MRIAFVADVHVGNLGAEGRGGPISGGMNQRCRDVVDVLGRAAARAKEAGAERLVVLGDLFDRTEETTPQMVAAVQRALSLGPPAILVLGNHDQESTALGDNALAPLAPVAAVVERPTTVQVRWSQPPELPVLALELVVVPFRPGPAAEWFPGSLVEALDGCSVEARAPRVLAFHLGVQGPDTPPFLRGKDDSLELPALFDEMEQWGICAAFAGNWHDRRTWRRVKPRRQVLQVGTLCPTGFSNAGLDGYGTLAFFCSDARDVVWEEVPGPRFLKLQGALDEKVLGTRPARDGWRVHAQVLANPEDFEATTARVSAAREMGLLSSGSVTRDDAEDRAAARTAAQNAKAAESVEEAVIQWIGAHPLEHEDVDRALVVEATLGFLQCG